MSPTNTTTSEVNTAASTLMTMNAATSTSEVKKMVVLSSSDGHTFEVEETVALQSNTLKTAIEDCDGCDAIPLPNITAATLAKVMEYCKHHAAKDANAVSAVDANDVATDTFDSDLAKELADGDQCDLFDLILAANYLDIPKLLDLTCQVVSDKLKGKSPEYARDMFNIVNDFTPQEEDKLRKENEWAFEI